jgi:hypothetical protein
MHIDIISLMCCLSVCTIDDMLLPNITGWDGGGGGGGQESAAHSHTGGIRIETSRSNVNVMAEIFPTTVREIGPGFVVGKERIVTKTARNFTFKNEERKGGGGEEGEGRGATERKHEVQGRQGRQGRRVSEARVRYFDRNGWLQPNATVVVSVEETAAWEGERGGGGGGEITIFAAVDGGGTRAFAVID